MPATGRLWEREESLMRRTLLATAAAVALLSPTASWAGMDEAKAFLDTEINGLSTLSRADQEKEMQWYIDATAPFKGMNISVVSETIDTHVYESKVLAKAFSDITGINVTHDIIQEGDVVEKIQTQMQSGKNIYLVGGARTTASLINAGLVDELRLIAYPLIAGDGKALFASTERRRGRPERS